MPSGGRERSMKTAAISPVKNNFYQKYIKPYWYIYLMLLPAIVTMAIFCYGPMPGVLLAFKKYSARKGIWGSAWVGLKNFRILFTYADFWAALQNTVLISCGRLLFEFPAAIALALMLNEVRSGRYRKTLQTVFTFPHFLSWIIVAGILKNLLRQDGLVNAAIMQLGLARQPVNFLANPSGFRPLMYVTDIWKEVGWSAIIYMAAISSVDEQLYEAALMDGAGRFKQTMHVTLPCIAGTIAIMFIMQVGNLLNAGFDQIFNMRNAIVTSSANILDTYIYDMTFKSAPDYSFSAAVGLFKSAIGLCLILLADRFSYKISGQSLYRVG